MSFLFWLCLVLGGGLFLLSLFGEVFGVDADHHAFHADVPSGQDIDWGRIFSLRNATYFLFAFGATGVLLQWAWRGDRTLLATLLATGTGLLAWTLSAAAFNYLRRTESGEMPGDRVLIGAAGEVTLPILSDRTGKITVSVHGQSQELLARPLDETDGDPSNWKSVMVVEIRDGVALVTPYPDAAGEIEP